MGNNSNQDILTIFEIYRNTILSVDSDLRFWQSFLKLSIEDYRKKEFQPEELYSAIFVAYNIEPTTSNGWLKASTKALSIKSKDLEIHSKDFFSWVMNLSILKAYNSLEVFFIQSIHLAYFSTQKSPLNDKKATEKIHQEIKAYLTTSGINADTKNNRHIIQFLKQKSANIKSFLNQPQRIDLTTTWENFFELISILRNVIAHQGTVVSDDTLNEIKSKAKDVFQRHFALSPNPLNFKNLRPIDDQFLNLIFLMNDFAVNTVKLMFDKNDLSMFEMD